MSLFQKYTPSPPSHLYNLSEMYTKPFPVIIPVYFLISNLRKNIICWIREEENAAG